MSNTIEEFVDPEEKKKNIKWSAFVEGDVVNFFNKYSIEKLTIEDGNGNKAKLARQKNDEIKVESSSITIL